MIERKATWTIRIVATLGLWLAAPSRAGADNCSSLNDCFSTSRSAIAALTAVLVFATLALDPGSVLGTLKGFLGSRVNRNDGTRSREEWDRALGILPPFKDSDDVQGDSSPASLLRAPQPPAAGPAATGELASRDAKGNAAEAARHGFERPDRANDSQIPSSAREWIEDAAETWEEYVTPETAGASRTDWRAITRSSLTPLERELLYGVLYSPNVVAGGTLDFGGAPLFSLEYWLSVKSLAWNQRWQDVYSRAIFERAASGMPVHVIIRPGWKPSDVVAAEEGARASGIANIPVHRTP
jgi:hypothetical protein